jgi:hypothetical protein
MRLHAVRRGTAEGNKSYAIRGIRRAVIRRKYEKESMCAADGSTRKSV